MLVFGKNCICILFYFINKWFFYIVYKIWYTEIIKKKKKKTNKNKLFTIIFKTFMNRCLFIDCIAISFLSTAAFAGTTKQTF